jgi:hypothetical protein
MKLLVVLSAAAAPAAALACAACARDAGPHAWAWVGALLAVPYAAVALVIRALRRAGVTS